MSWHVKRPTKLFTKPRADSDTVRDPFDPTRPLHVLFSFEIQILRHAGGWREIRARSGAIDETGWVGANQLFEDTAAIDEDIDVEAFLRSLRKKAHDAGFGLTLAAYVGAVAWLRTRVRNVIEDRAQGPIGPFSFSVTRWNELIRKYDDLGLIAEDIVDWTDQAEIATAFSAEHVTELTQLFDRLGRQVGQKLGRPKSADLYIADLLGLDAAKEVLKAGPIRTGDSPVEPNRTIDKPLEEVYKDEDDTRAFVRDLLARHGDTFLTNGEPKTIAKTLADLSDKFDEAYAALKAQIDMIRGELRSVTAGAHLTTLGELSREFEAKGPGHVSEGTGDKGGRSYGSYQMTSKPNGGTVKRFLDEAMPAQWRHRFQGLTPGGPAFGAAWEKLAKDEPEAFFAAQHAYIKKTHFDELVAKIKADDGLDVKERSSALQDVVWSTAVQHGPNSEVVGDAIEKVGGSANLAGDPSRDRELIKAIYAERGKPSDDGGLSHFRGNSRDVQEGVRARFVKEEAQALRMFDAEFAGA